MTSANSWEDAKLKYPINSPVRGKVKAAFPFGVFIELEGEPEVKAFLDVASYNPSGDISDHVPLPQVGDVVEGSVSTHSDRDKQIRLRVGPAFWEQNAGRQSG